MKWWQVLWVGKKRTSDPIPIFGLDACVRPSPFYPYSCNPDDIMTATECMHERYYFADVQMRGHYPAFAKKEWERGKYSTGDGTERLEQILAEGVCDYLGFSYYMTNAVKADVQKDTTTESLDGSSANSVPPNPYVKSK